MGRSAEEYDGVPRTLEEWNGVPRSAVLLGCLGASESRKVVYAKIVRFLRGILRFGPLGALLGRLWGGVPRSGMESGGGRRS